MNNLGSGGGRGHRQLRLHCSVESRRGWRRPRIPSWVDVWPLPFGVVETWLDWVGYSKTPWHFEGALTTDQRVTKRHPFFQLGDQDKCHPVCPTLWNLECFSGREQHWTARLLSSAPKRFFASRVANGESRRRKPIASFAQHCKFDDYFCCLLFPINCGFLAKEAKLATCFWMQLKWIFDVRRASYAPPTLEAGISYAGRIWLYLNFHCFAAIIRHCMMTSSSSDIKLS